MASFRTGFKIFGEISLKQGLGRIRSFSEDRKPGQWLPEDQWAVRQPGSTCPDPCEKPKKPPKPSKSWLSLCKDPDAPKDPECDIRHSNCPPPIKSDAPWYSLQKLIPKKKQEKPPPLQSCREEMKRRELNDEEEVCENIDEDKTPSVDIKPEPSECCVPKEPCPAPVVTLSCPPPKELDLMLWCGQPPSESSRVAAKCQSDKLPYQEFRPPKVWKTPPFSLPIKNNLTFSSSRCFSGSVAYEEFKHVEIPKPLYTRYKSVELCDSSMLLCMTEVQCPDDNDHCLGIKPLPPPPPCSIAYSSCCREPAEVEKKEKEACPEKRVLESASCKPVPIKKATKYEFRPKPTKLIERRVYKNPLANKTCDFRPPKENDEESCKPSDSCECSEPPKVITATLTHEPQMYERHLPLSCKPPKWMYALCKPGYKETPLVPSCEDFPKEPDWCSETDGLNFYDSNNENITPIPPPDPCLAQKKEEEKKEKPPPCKPEPIVVEPAVPCFKFRNRFVLMPEYYNIKNTRGDESKVPQDNSNSSFEKFIEVKTAEMLKTTKSYPPIKENILYDLQRLCPNPPLDPSKIKAPCRKPPDSIICRAPPRFYRRFSTFTPSALEKLRSIQLFKIQQRTECGDSSSKCKARKLVPKARTCPEPAPKPECSEISLPCCPKGRVPPDCNVKRPMPICKKKLPPKPSFSECSRDPLPCPKITECDCWEKKMGGKNRKYSDWAITRAEFNGRQQNEPAKVQETKSEFNPKQLESKSEVSNA